MLDGEAPGLFSNYFERSQELVDNPYVMKTYEPSISPNGHVICIIDQKGLLLKSYAWALAGRGYKVVTFQFDGLQQHYIWNVLSDQQKSLIMFEIMNAQANVYLIDLMLAWAHGQDIARYMRAKMQDTKIVFMSGLKKIDELSTITPHYLEKPINDDELFELLRLLTAPDQHE